MVAKAKQSGCGAGCLTIIGLVVVLGIIGSFSGQNSNKSAGSGTKSPTIAATQSGDATRSSLEDSIERVASCDTGEMAKAGDGIDVLSWREEASICQVANSSLGHMPEIGVLRMLLRSAFLISHDNETNPKDEAYQLMNVVEARDLTAPDRVKSTLDLVFRINKVTNGHVSPRDMNVFLRSSGEMAKTMSDEGLSNMAFVVWEMKKKNGE